jgi:hypothetical protein
VNDNDDLQHKLLNKIGLTPQSIATATVNATGVDMGNAGAYVLVSVIVGTVSSGGTATVKLQSSRNDNTADAGAAADAYADITGATVSITATDAGTLVQFKTNVRAEKYVRVVATTSGTIFLGAILQAHPTVVGTVQAASAS